MATKRCNDEKENMRILKFKTLIEEVSGMLTGMSTDGSISSSTGGIMSSSTGGIMSSSTGGLIIGSTGKSRIAPIGVLMNVGSALSQLTHNSKRKCLPLIFNCEDFNDYAKIIYDNSTINIIFKDASEKSNWDIQFPNLEKFDDSKTKMDAGTALVRKLNSDELHKIEAYKFIFWSLMILAVDDKNKDEYLSLICDYARMFKISDDEMKDMVNVIKFIFQDKTAQPIKAANILRIFVMVLKMYEH